MGCALYTKGDVIKIIGLACFVIKGDFPAIGAARLLEFISCSKKQELSTGYSPEYLRNVCDCSIHNGTQKECANAPVHSLVMIAHSIRLETQRNILDLVHVFVRSSIVQIII